MNSVSPVYGPDEVQYERTIQIDPNQPSPLVVLPVTLEVTDPADPSKTIVHPNWGVAARYRLTDAEREAVASGADLVITELVMGRTFAPLNLQFLQPEQRPEL